MRCVRYLFERNYMGSANSVNCHDAACIFADYFLIKNKMFYGPMRPLGWGETRATLRNYSSDVTILNFPTE